METAPQPKIAFVDIDTYMEFNCKLSLAKGYDIEQPTERCLPMNPRAAKVNIQYDSEGVEVGYQPAIVLPISSEVQMNYSELITGLNLQPPNYTPVDAPILEFITALNDMDVVNWNVNQIIRVNGIGENVIMYVAQQLYDNLTTEQIDSLLERGVNVQVFQ
ncbi:hypothetical protein [Mariniphaga sediminis]|uniref:hypothetical protein n=1 Tax=Mariniphaga sediminis TaxID=1628158 RepID=UPI003562054E